ncbi:MAG: alpha/beta hydrolase [Porticoccaceae bacterium]|nr:alpha/beta hydrolase [Porticoccaceae bacterium]
MTIHIPAFELPESELLSDKSKAVLKAYRDSLSALIADASAAKNENSEEASASPDKTIDPKQQFRERFYQRQAYQNLRERYDVEIEKVFYGGVLTETFISAEGIAANNQQRILINLHGGNFDSGSQTNSHMESIAVAAIGRIKVISVDYRMAPEYKFPAATEDVVRVYKALLTNYAPENIGIYGASSGAHLCAQTMVRLQEEGIPLPGAIGLIAEGAVKMTGDSVAFIGALLKSQYGMDLAEALKNIQYLKDADLNSPQVTPAQSDKFLSMFPPTLLISSSRDFMLSSVLSTHSRLINLGVEAQLHVWEGLDHIFHYNPELPETTELHQITVKFFEKHLG